eukprot:COSAG01_NODE_11166_length_1991_cov_3.449260_1_plen_64_part_10
MVGGWLLPLAVFCDWRLCAVHDGDGGPGRDARVHADGGALDYEAELCIVIGKKCRNATLEMQPP